MTENKTKIYILTGKSGSGKDAIQNILIKSFGMNRIVSTTSRPMRDGETEGVNYHYISREAFEQGIADDNFLEYRTYDTTVKGIPDTWYYGCPKQQLDANKTYVIILDMQGAERFIEHYGKENCFVINIQTDDEIREQRAMKRGSFDKTEWDRRLADDAVKFSTEIIKRISNLIIINNNVTLDALVKEIAAAGKIYFQIADENSNENTTSFACDSYDTRKFDCIEDALDTYRARLSSDDRNVTLSNEIMVKLKEDFTECTDDMSDASAKEFNETVIKIIEKAYNVQLYGYDN